MGVKHKNKRNASPDVGFLRVSLTTNQGEQWNRFTCLAHKTATNRRKYGLNQSIKHPSILRTMFGGGVLLLLLATALTASSSLLERYALTDCPDDAPAAGTTATVPSLTGNASLLREMVWEGRNASTFECDRGLGIRIVTAPANADADFQTNNGPSTSMSSGIIWQSNATIAALQEHYASFPSSAEAFGLTLALWLSPIDLTPQVAANQVQVVLALGNEVPRSNSDWLCAPLQLAQWQQYLMVTFRDTDQICRQLVVRAHTLEPETIAHVVVSFDASALSVFIDGVVAVQGAPKTIPDLTIWEDTTTLRLFGIGSNVNVNQHETVFSGWIQQVDMYDRAFNATDASNLYNEGIIFVQKPDDEIFLPPNNNGQDLEVTIAQDNTEGIEIQLSSLVSDVGPLTIVLQLKELPKHGALLTDSGSTFLVDDILYANITEVALCYKLHSTVYFNAPRMNGFGVALGNKKPDTFAYRWIALHPQTLETMHTSDLHTVSIHVVHVNHAPSTLTVPLTTAKITKGSTTIEVVTGNIAVADPLDLNLDRVRIDISCSFGQLTLHPAYLDLADFESCRHRTLSDWQCVGTGVEDRNMTFLALPEDAPFLMRNLQYQPFTPGEADVIQIRLYDGASTSQDQLGCLYRSEHEAFSVGRLGNRFTTLHRECWRREASIEVEAYKDTASGGSDSVTHFKIVKSVVSLGSIVVLVFCICCGCCRRLLPSCLARGGTVEADNVYNFNNDNKNEETKEELSPV